MRKKEQKPIHTCDECSRGQYDMQFKNLSIYGKPTLIICPLCKWKKLLTEYACKDFIPKQKAVH